ncbi:uncharacterized protein MEPE_01210 [Melanopsichium pennsylvanicum]|uniref:Uncharacterized protein n=1 Tax=Melanopsichium pennsylvanicum TaxID=63383 RepID=A0AAJ4XHJ3_9BASI|nr:uncharacterized protein MEPE_01210 [Melanopsichium pennsylvanicum]
MPSFVPDMRSCLITIESQQQTVLHITLLRSLRLAEWSFNCTKNLEGHNNVTAEMIDCCVLEMTRQPALQANVPSHALNSCTYLIKEFDRGVTTEVERKLHDSAAVRGVSAFVNRHHSSAPSILRFGSSRRQTQHPQEHQLRSLFILSLKSVSPIDPDLTAMWHLAERRATQFETAPREQAMVATSFDTIHSTPSRSSNLPGGVQSYPHRGFTLVRHPNSGSILPDRTNRTRDNAKMLELDLHSCCRCQEMAVEEALHDVQALPNLVDGWIRAEFEPEDCSPHPKDKPERVTRLCRARMVQIRSFSCGA